MARNRVYQSRLLLVSLGLLLGYLARLVLGAPADESKNKRTIDPVPDTIVQPDEQPFDFPLDRNQNETSNKLEQGGLVAPLIISDNISNSNSINSSLASYPGDDQEFDHDLTASFEAHGEQLCASGCAASRHPTKELNSSRFQQLLDEVLIEPMDSTNNALEELLYFGRQTRRMIENFGFGELGPERSAILWDELQISHARISIRLVDEHGEVRSWLEPTRVPFDRRHVFDMKTSQLQPLVTSGTVKRVGMKHLWVRL